MAVARVTLVCPTCGKEFEKTKTCYNRKEADRWEEYMKDAEMECPECYKARKKAEMEDRAAEIVAKFGMPEITGVSEKQIKYANDLRNKYLAETLKDIDFDYTLSIFAKIKTLLANGDWERRCAAIAEKYGRSADEAQLDSLRRHLLDKIVVLVYTGDAHAIIEMLTGWWDPEHNDSVYSIINEAMGAMKESTTASTATEEGNDNNATAETTATTETKKPTYDKSAIMRSAWAKKKAAGDKKTFSECLREAWAEAKKAAGVETTAAKRTRRSTKATNAVYAY